MKVLQINSVFGVGSTGRICEELSNYLEKSGHDAYIAYSHGNVYGKGYKFGNVLGTKMHGLLSRIFGLQAYFSRHSTKKLLKYIGSLKPDIIHLHNLHSNCINLKMLLRYISRNDIATVITLHDCWFFTGKCTHYTLDNCFKWREGCENCPRLRKDNTSWFFDRTKKMYSDKKRFLSKVPRLAVVGVSDWITEEAKKSLLSSAEIITRIYNWIDLDKFKVIHTVKLRDKLKLQNKFVILGVASGWSNSKGLDKFIELAKVMSQDMLIILVGNISSNISIFKNIINIAHTDNITELIEYYSMADVFVNLSLEESFGLVTAEALACGTPVISNGFTANPELVGEGCGYVVENKAVDDIINAILEVKKNGKSFYSENCVKFARSNFDKNQRIGGYLTLYQEILK